MRKLQAAVVVSVLMVAGVASADSRIELNLFGSASSLSFGFGVHHHARRRVVVTPPPVYVQPAPIYVQPAPVYVPPPVYVEQPVVIAPPPMVQAPPPVVVAPAPVVVQPAPPVRVETRTVTVTQPALGLKYTPGLSGIFTASSSSVGFSGARFTHSAGLEARLSRWVALRSDVELRNDSRSFDVIGLKVWLAGGDWKVKPYVSASLSGTMADSRPNALSVGVVGAGGVDVFFGKHFFLEAEVRYRALPGSCCTEVPQLTGVVGGGVAFF
jgi:hypothetical protein